VLRLLKLGLADLGVQLLLLLTFGLLVGSSDSGGCLFGFLLIDLSLATLFFLQSLLLRALSAFVLFEALHLSTVLLFLSSLSLEFLLPLLLNLSLQGELHLLLLL
jgi:hypothetical protein